MASTSPACPDPGRPEPRSPEPGSPEPACSGSRWRRRDGLRLRPVPELEICLVYRRDPPRLFRLSPEPALVLGLAGGGAEGRSEAELSEGFARRWPAAGRAQLDASFRASLALLRAEGLVEPVEETTRGRAPRTMRGGDGR